ncbi:uncharacterized protein C9orf40 homolog [Thalassophryne amazonica]|uniref:uncharacterized protein C9orf40 homolog n=1 Tax=Thalassophryne amazonica TaxID=390379 RepID=UPI001470E80C|nr:uncharacterized protein C9orf40 homolog [Thalassophryne amazonica]
MLSGGTADMAKRRAEDTLLHDSPSKKRYRPLPDMRLDSTVEPPSVLALLGSRCRKRPSCSSLDPEQCSEEDGDGAPSRSSSRCDPSKQLAACALSLQASGSFHDRLSSSTAKKSKKRPRLDNKSSEAVTEKAQTTAVVDSNNDYAYNSFQYWRVPLPPLDLSLLEDENDHSKANEESKVMPWKHKDEFGSEKLSPFS